MNTSTQYDTQRKAEQKDAQIKQDMAYMVSLGIVPVDLIKPNVLVVTKPADTHAVTMS
jgi:hypothetical protein